MPQEVSRPCAEIPGAAVEPFSFSQKEGQEGLNQDPVIVRIWPSTSWLPQRESTGVKTILGPRQVVYSEEGTHTFRICSACDAQVLVKLSMTYLAGQRLNYEDRPQTCHGCGSAFELPRIREKPLTPEQKSTIYAAIGRSMAADDRYPS